MKKIILIISIVSLMLIVVFFVFSNIKKEPVNLQLTQEEKEFIDNNKDNIFLMGYYNTPSEELIIRKLCLKLSQDTGLKIFPFKEIWSNNLKLLQSGQLAMVANMNVTDNRLKYAHFTSSFASLNIGIYSNYDNKINQYSDLIGKKIGIEKSVYIIDDFKIKYPEIQFDKIYYNNLDELKMALTKGKIDGFMSSKSYSENLNFFYFNIKSLSIDNNHIGFSKDYPVLYNIIKKEVNYLIDIGWDKEARDLVDFYIETKQIKLTDQEKNLIKNNGTITVGLPKDYSYYAYGDDYPNGIMPALFTKIEFLTGLDFIYYYDSYENLIVRDDVDIIVSSDSLPFFSTAPIFSNNLIAVSNGNWNSIEEIYELEPYIIGMVNNTVFINEIKSIMPYLDIRLYVNYEDLYMALEKKNIDYAVLPDDLFGKKQSRSGLVNNGVIYSKFHYAYSKDKNTLIEIINKCLSVINIDAIVNEEVSQLIDEEENFNKTIFLMILLSLMIYIFIRYIIKLKDNVNRLLYYDQESMFHNELWLRTKLEINYNNYIYFLVNPQNLNFILERYGENAYKKAQKNMLTTFNEHVKNHEYVIKLLSNNYLFIKKPMEETSRVIFLNQLKYLFNKRFTIFDINFNYQMNVVSLKPEDENYNFDKLIKRLNIGIQYAEYTRDVVDYTFDTYSKYKRKIDYDAKLSSAIINEEISIHFNKMFSIQDELYGFDVFYSCHLDELGEVSFINLKRNVTRLGLETIFDKVILKKLFDIMDKELDMNANYFIEINKKTLHSENFFNWLEERMILLKKSKLYLKVDIDTYENLMEISRYSKNSQIDFLLIDFDNNLVDGSVIKDYDIRLVEINASLFADIERNSEVIDFIIYFCRKYNKTIIVSAISTLNQFQSIKDYNIDYYINNFRGNDHEGINR